MSSLSNFTGGGIWQEGSCEGSLTATMQLGSGDVKHPSMS